MSELTMALDSSEQKPSNVFARPTEPPKWLYDDKGRMKRTMDDLDISKGQVHLLLPSGIGDCAWPWSKFAAFADELKAEGRELIWHFPRDNTRRIAPYAQLVGMNVGSYLEMDNFRLYDGEFERKDFENGGVFYLHANVHIEHGKPLHSNSPRGHQLWEELGHTGEAGNDVIAKTWHPWLPFRNPAPPLKIVHEGERPPQTSEGESVWKYADPSMRKPYITVHVGSRLYGEGNWFPYLWAKMIEKIEEVAPVQLIGFGPTGEIPFIEKIVEEYTPHMPAVIDRTFSTAMTQIVNSSALIGIDDGLTILATYYGLPVLQSYPRWLTAMRGTWEDNAALHPHRKAILIEELWEYLPKWLEGLEVV